MHIRKASFVSAVVLAAAAFAIVPAIKADEWDKRTVINITEPIQLPSCCNAEHVVTLQPGTYVMALVDSQSDRHIVRVFEKDGKTVITTILAVPNYRLKPTGKTVFQFWETPAGQPVAMRAWFYPGDNFGQEFAYPKTKSIEIARAVGSSVPAAQVETEADLQTAPVLIVDEKGQEKALEVLVARNDVPVNEPAAITQQSPAPVRLPDTGSAYPLLASIGLASLFASLLLFRFTKRA